MRAKNINFVIAASQVIRIKKIDIVLILFTKRDYIKLNNIVLIPKCNSNLISTK